MFLDVLPDTEYNVRVAGIIDDVDGHYSPWINVTTLEHDVTNTWLHAYNVSPSDVLINWKLNINDSLESIKILDNNKNG